MIDAPLALAFTAGMVATVNPCGFAMLPAYLSFFVGADERGSGALDARAGIARALAVGLSVSAGFAATFAVIGLIVKHVTQQVLDWSPWITVVIGIALVGLGIALLLGWELKVALPRLDKGGRTRGAFSMFVFGVSYAIASLGCTLPIFLAQVGSTFRTANLLSGVAVFFAYSIGFTVVLVSLTVALALARQSIVHGLRRVLPFVQRISGALLIVTGAYVAYYGVYEVRLDPGAEDTVVDRVTSLSSDIQAWVDRTGGMRIGLVLTLVIAAAAAFTLTRRRRPSRTG